MPNYKYRVILEDGKVSRGRIIAQSRTQAINILRKDNIQPFYIKKTNEIKPKYKRLDYGKLLKQEKIKRADVARKKDTKKIKNWEDVKGYQISFRRVSSSDIIVFANNLYILKKAKFNNIQALKSLHQGIENPAFKNVVEDLLLGVQAGERLYAVMEGYPKVFPQMFINFIRVGEESGTLDTALLYARDYIESSQYLRKKIRGAIIPKVLQFVFIMLAMFLSLIFGVPLLESVYDMFGSTQEMPKATMVALGMAQWVSLNWHIVVLFFVAIGLIFYIYINTPRGRYNWDKLIMRMPVIGPLNTNITVSKFFQGMLLNLRNGMRIQESLEVSKNVSSNYYFLSAVELAKSNSLAGESWITPFEEKEIFRPMVSQMVEIGMQTDLAEMMEKVNEYINMQIDESIARFVKFLPDITYLFVGIALIAFMITVMVPLINVYMGGFITM